MKVLLLTSPKIIKSPYIQVVSKICDLTVLDFKKSMKDDSECTANLKICDLKNIRFVFD